MIKGSLCTGTGALDAATPGEPTWVAELDAEASIVLKREHPEAENLGDITTLLERTTTSVDELSSGDPCQSMSLAGRRLARGDARFLWPYVAEIVREMRPREVFLENVQGLVSLESGALLRLRLDDLRAAGYAVRWTVLGACAVGAPHHRHRWFARAVHVGQDAPEAERVTVKCGAPRGGGRFLLPSPTASDRFGAGRAPGVQGGFLSQEAALKRIADPKRSSNLQDVVASLLPTPRASDGERGRGNCSQVFGAGSMTLGAAAHESQWGKFAEAVALWEQITGVPVPAPTELGPKGGPRLTAALPEWMMGMRPGLVTEGMPRSAALKMAGNGVVTLQARTAHEILAPR